MEEMMARRALLVVSVVLAVLELADGLRLGSPWAASVYAVALLAGAYWLWRTGSTAAVLLLGALHLLELLMLLVVYRTGEQAPPPGLWWLLVVVTAAGTVAAGWTLVSRGRMAPRAPSHP